MRYRYDEDSHPLFDGLPMRVLLTCKKCGDQFRGEYDTDAVSFFGGVLCAECQGEHSLEEAFERISDEP